MGNALNNIYTIKITTYRPEESECRRLYWRCASIPVVYLSELRLTNLAFLEQRRPSCTVRSDAF